MEATGITGVIIGSTAARGLDLISRAFAWLGPTIAPQIFAPDDSGLDGFDVQ